ncbi:MAG: response regulator, partial [Planctomycetes bacterium]|nr:response regulator [Planctomycetota bacterium]
REEAMTAAEPRILLVDDEQAVLDALRRQHGRAYNLVTRCGAAAGLDAVTEEGPFAAVVSDFKMPGMTGTQFLANVAGIAPDTVRVMLTGQADLQTAIDAVNRGHIFRFLTKPCEPDVLRATLDAALRQWRLINTERELLEQTVRGSIEVLTDVLALSNPIAFGRAQRIRNLVVHIVTHLGLVDGWQYETAALLSQIGLVAVPDELLRRVVAGERLPAAQAAMYDNHPQVARDLIARIPRLHDIAEMVARQDATDQPAVSRAAAIGGRMLAAATTFEEILSLGGSRDQALAALERERDSFDGGVIEALATAPIPDHRDASRIVPLCEVELGMVVQEDIVDLDGRVVLASGHTVTDGALQRLRNHVGLGRIDQRDCLVTMPVEACGAAPITPHGRRHAAVMAGRDR